MRRLPTFRAWRSGADVRVAQWQFPERLRGGGRFARTTRCAGGTPAATDGITPHSALSIPHLNGSFPEFILGWTIEAIGV